MVDKKKTIENVLFIIFMLMIVILIFITIKTKIMGEEPSILGYRLFVVDSGSMSPTLKIGTLTLVKELEPRGIEKGDIISYYGSGTSVVTHRVVDIENKGASFITKGDANETEDPLSLDSNKLIGKVIFSIPYIGLLLKLIKSKIGLVGIGIIVLIGIITQTFRVKKDKDEIDSKGSGVN